MPNANSQSTIKHPERRNRKLNFLFVPEDKFPPFRVDVSVLFGEEMVSRGHTIEWIFQSQDACESSYRTVWSGCRVWVGSTNVGATRWARFDKHVRKLIHDLRMFALMRERRFDFIQVKDKFLSALCAIVAARVNRTKFIYWLSFPFPEADMYKVKAGAARYPAIYFVRGVILKFLLYRIILPFADHVFVQSVRMKEDIAAMGIDKAKLTPMPMGIPKEMFTGEYHSGELSVSVQPMKVVYLGSLAKARKLGFLVRAFRDVVSELPAAKLYLVGGGDDETDIDLLKSEAQHLGIEQAVVFTGFLPREEALTYVRDASVCVSPFYPTPIFNSTSPTKLVEYMALAKAVVANDHPEQRMLIEQSGGGICVPYEERAFAAAIVELLKHPQQAIEMGARGRRYVRDYRSYDKLAEMLEREYFRLVADEAAYEDAEAIEKDETV